MAERFGLDRADEFWETIAGGKPKEIKPKAKPTIYTKFSVKPESVNEFIQKVSSIGDKLFKQTSIHILRNAKLTEKFGIKDTEKGISIEPYIEILFNKQLTLKKIAELDPLLEKYELVGSTMKPDGSGIELYNVSVYNKNYEKYIQNIKKFYEELHGRGLVKGYTEGIKQVWSIAYTTKDGLTTYKRISGEVRVKSEEKPLTEPYEEPIRPHIDRGEIKRAAKERAVGGVSEIPKGKEGIFQEVISVYEKSLGNGIYKRERGAKRPRGIQYVKFFNPQSVDFKTFSCYY